MKRYSKVRQTICKATNRFGFMSRNMRWPVPEFLRVQVGQYTMYIFYCYFSNLLTKHFNSLIVYRLFLLYLRKFVERKEDRYQVTAAQRWRVCFYLSCAHEILCCAHELLSHGHNVLISGHEIVNLWERDTMPGNK
jgi:hypothetical protein